MSLLRYFLVVAGLPVAFAAGGQTIAIIGNTDSLIIAGKLDEIVISADKTDGHDSARLLKFSENVDEVLDQQQGINLVRRGNYASEITARGLSSERIGTTINGMKIFSACTDKMDPASSYVSANNLKSADFHQNGQSKCFSSNSGGLINFNTKDASLNDSKTVRGNVSAGYNSVASGKQVSFNTNYSKKNWAFRVNGLISSQENYTAGGGEEIKFSQYDKTNFGLSFKTKLTDRDYIMADLIVDQATNVGYPALPMDVATADAKIYSLTYVKYFNGQLSSRITSKIYCNNILHIMDDSQRDVVMRMDMPGKSDTYGFYTLTEFSEKKGHLISVMADAYINYSLAEMTMYPENEEEMYMLTWPGVDRKMLGLYVSDNYKLKNNNSVFITTRFDMGQDEITKDLGKKQLEVFGYNADHPFQHRLFSISGSYTWNLKKKNSLIVETAYSERQPSVSEQYGFYLFNSQDAYDYIGNPEIKNERAFKGEITYQKKYTAFNWNGALYTYYMPDYILGIVKPEYDAMTMGAVGVKFYENINYALLSGMEAGFSIKIVKNIKVLSDFTYTYGRDYRGNALPLIPPLKNTSEIYLYAGKNIISVKVTSASRQNRISAESGEDFTPAYCVSDVNYQRTFNIRSCQLLALTGMQNIFDVRYNDHLDWNNIPRPGRNIFIKFQLQF